MKDLKDFMRSSLFIILPLLGFALIYLFAVIIKCDFDISHWLERERVLFVFLGFIFMGLGFIAASTIND
jgi:positive regulator of sigma E activity